VRSGAGAVDPDAAGSGAVRPAAARGRLALQLFLTLLILALVPGGWLKLGAFLLVWAATFRGLSLRELGVYAAVSALFAVMDIMAVRQGVFRFTSPDYLGLPVWEFGMWGFYVLHTVRMLDGPPPAGPLWKVLALAALFALPFVTLADQQALLLASALLFAVALGFFHEPADLRYVGYMIAVGAVVEYLGVWSGQWSYPANPPGGVAFWFVTMWGGIGLFTRRLLLRLL
jgi:hypothetical protein